MIFAGVQTVIAREVSTKKPVIIQLTEGHGNAVFSLVHLDLLTDEQMMENHDLDTPSLNYLRQSKSARISMLSQILQLLGMNCQPLNVPELTPVSLLARKMVSILMQLKKKKKKMTSAKSSCLYYMLWFYPWFKFYFPLFQTHYHTLPYPGTIGR